MGNNLKPGEQICPRCDGSGYQTVNDHGTLGECFKCLGAGRLDWVEAVVGKKVDWGSINLNRRRYPKLIAKDLIDIQPMTDIKWGRDDET